MERADLASEVAEIDRYVRRLSARERKILLKGLRRKILMNEAKELSRSVNKDIEISMEDILDEINAVRRKNAA